MTLQFCLAHLIRDVKFLVKFPSKKVQAYGDRLCEALRTLFRVFHQREKMPAVGWKPGAPPVIASESLDDSRAARA